MPESPRDIRRRIRSTKGLAQITRALQQVATARLRKAQQRASNARPYSDGMREVLLGLSQSSSSTLSHPLLEKRPVKSIAIIEITPDRGLCGGLISNVNRAVGRAAAAQSAPVTGFALGRRGRDYLRRNGINVVTEEIALGDYPELERIQVVTRAVIEGFTSGKFDVVYIAYTRFTSMLRQDAVLDDLLPLSAPESDKMAGSGASMYEYEPDTDAVLNALLPRYVEVQIYRALLESKASEQAARLVAMRNATDNAKELVSQYTLKLNKVRQSQITTEISEIAAGAEALRK